MMIDCTYFTYNFLIITLGIGCTIKVLLVKPLYTVIIVTYAILDCLLKRFSAISEIVLGFGNCSLFKNSNYTLLICSQTIKLSLTFHN